MKRSICVSIPFEAVRQSEFSYREILDSLVDTSDLEVIAQPILHQAMYEFLLLDWTGKVLPPNLRTDISGHMPRIILDESSARKYGLPKPAKVVE